MSKKQLVILLLFIFIIILLNNFFMKFFDMPANFKVEEINKYNKTELSSQQLFNLAWRDIRNSYFDSTLNNQRWYRWKNRYRDKIQTDDDAKVAINTMLESLNDPYSNFMDKGEFNEQALDIDSRVMGIGVNIASLDGKITVMSVVEDSPAYFAQLKNDDIILKVNGKDVSGKAISDVASSIRGPVNSVVELLILRNNNKIIKKIKRKEIKIKTVKGSMDKDVGYIQIYTFIGSDMPSEFIEALDKTSKAKGLLIDLRGNPGGLLPNAIFVTELFLNPGDDIVNVIGRSGFKKKIFAQNSMVSINKPLVILVDGTSASASEVFSGAMRDYDRAKIVGTKTFGKGMVQQIMPLPNGTGMNLTIAKYLTPKGIDINKKGLEPDVKVEFTEDDVQKNYDRQLVVAKKELRQMIYAK